MAEKLEQQLKELGSRLEKPPSSADALVGLLKQCVACLSELDQSPPKSMLEAMQPFLNAIAEPELMNHQDQEVKLFVAACLCEITRITAPEPPYDDDTLKDIFQLTVSTFSGLSDTRAPTFANRVVILDTLARYRSCVVMLDLECDDLINEMFNTFFAVVRDEHHENVLTSMQTIMEVLIEESEDVQENLVLTLLSVLGRDEEDVTMAARRLAMSVIENCAGKLEPGIKQYLVSSMSGDSSSVKPDISYHAVLYNIYKCAPQILTGVVPYINGELLREQVDTRLKAVGLVGDLFALPGSTISKAFQPVFTEFLKRLTDRVLEVRMAVLAHVKSCLLVNPFRAEASQIISALCDHLLDDDEIVRKQVVSIVCDVASNAPSSIKVETIKLISDLLQDKSLLLKRYTMERLADIHRVSCINRSESSAENDAYDWIVGKILRCIYDEDFGSDKIEPILSLSLFPNDFSVKDKVTNWIRIFAGFDKIEVKALEKILEQKQRVQHEMQKYISLRQSPEESDGSETQKKVMLCFRVMSPCFSDPAKAEENFKILDQLKDSKFWEHLKQLVDPNTSSPQGISVRDELLKVLGHEHRLYEFLSSLSLKCSYILFDKDHVKEVLQEAGVLKTSGNNDLILSCMTILVILSRFCPLLLGGIEEDLACLLEDDNEIIKEGTLHILAKAGGTIREQLGVSSRSLDLILERICFEGNRRQAKYAVHALASITKDAGLMSLSVLYKRLVDMLEEKMHLPAVLQSLGCIAQAAMPVFETRESEIEKFIKEYILQREHMVEDKEPGYWDDRSELCSLKIFGVKTLVKSYLPVQDAHLRSGIDRLIEILKNILSFGEISREIKSSLIDKAHMKLAAAKAVLRLSKHWEHKIPIDVFYLTLRTSEDNFPDVKRTIFNKIHQYVKDRNLDPKFACTFLLDISSQQSDLEENKRNLNDIVQMFRQGRVQHYSSQADPNSPSLYPEHLLLYVVHSLAHHPSFPNIDECKDAKAYEAMYRQLYLFLSMLLDGKSDGNIDVRATKDKGTVSLLYSIFLCIKHSEDVFDSTKSKNSYALCDLGLSILKRLAPKQVDPQDSSASVILPSVLYKPLEKKEDDELPFGQEKTWLADDCVLAHFQSLELEANGMVNSVIEDDILKESETEPLAKLMKRLKAKAAKARKEVKNEPAPAVGANANEFDILEMVKEINSDNLGTNIKPGSSNGLEQVHEKEESSNKLQKRKSLFSKSMDVPVPKRKRTASTHSRKPLQSSPSKGSGRPTKINLENTDVGTEKIDEELPTKSKQQPIKEKIAKSAESDLVVSRVGKKSSASSKQKGKRSDRDQMISFIDSMSAKKSKKVAETAKKHSSSGKVVHLKKQKQKKVISKCTTKENGNSSRDLIDQRVKIWWPLDKKFYEGVVKSFDSEEKKHAILYDDGEVEVLCLEKERWELLDKGKKTEVVEILPNNCSSLTYAYFHLAKVLTVLALNLQKSGSPKGLHPKGGSSGKKRKSTAGSERNKELEEKSLSSKARGKSTPHKSVKHKQKEQSKSKSTVGSSGHPDVAHLKKSKPSYLDSGKNKSKKIRNSGPKEISSDDEKLNNKDDDKGSPEAELNKEEETDSENTESDDFGRDARKSHDGADASSDEMEVDKKEAPANEDEDTNNQLTTSEEKKPSDSGSLDAEISDDELLHVEETCGEEINRWEQPSLIKLLDLDNVEFAAC
ncbi:sister chromatid cohesion protein pds5 [Striga asiatica]|uniref:Sister chromatid cohesion protein pds5 n=1 Tax=Striga asiatica TaxID=4170 RepID=A0A5A7R992_STRAF|nr:sister chromatid cohesion protein pds5 [Striga asiatica]